MPKPKFDKEAYLRMLDQKLDGVNNFPVARLNEGQDSMLQRLRRTIPVPKTKNAG